MKGTLRVLMKGTRKRAHQVVFCLGKRGAFGASGFLNGFWAVPSGLPGLFRNLGGV